MPLKVHCQDEIERWHRQALADRIISGIIDDPLRGRLHCLLRDRQSAMMVMDKHVRRCIEAQTEEIHKLRHDLMRLGDRLAREVARNRQNPSISCRCGTEHGPVDKYPEKAVSGEISA